MDLEGDDIDALNSETFGDDVQTNWEIADHDQIAYGYGDQDSFPPPSNGETPTAAQNVYEDIKELDLQTVAAKILDDEDEGARHKRHTWADNREDKLEHRQPGAAYNNEAGAQKPVRVLTVQEVEQQLRNAPDHDLPQRPPPVNNELVPRPTMEQYYRQGAIPRNPPPGVLYLNHSSHVNRNQAPPPVPLQDHVPERPPESRPLYQRFSNPAQLIRPGPHAGNQRFPQPSQHYHQGAHFPQGHFPQGHYEPHPGPRQPFMPQGGMMHQDLMFNGRPRMQGQYHQRQGQPFGPVNMGQGRGRPNFHQHQHYGHQHQREFEYLKYQNPAVYPHHMDDRRIRHQGYEEALDKGSTDEYANLMTHQEKAFLKNIQLNALSIQNPYMDDYYHTVLNQRRSNAGHNTNHRHYDREIQNMNRELQSSKTLYIPQQFENSLGKLQIGSVSAPRKIIDTEVVDHETVNPPEENARGMPGRDKQCLLECEQGHFWLHIIQDGTLFSLSDETIEAARKSLIQLIQQRIDPMLNVNKGRDMIGRTMNLLVDSDLPFHVIRKLGLIYQRDVQGSYLFDQYFVPIRRFLSEASMGIVLEIADNCFNFLIWDKPFVMAVFAMMVERVAIIYEEGQVKVTEKQEIGWESFLQRMAGSIPRDIFRVHPTLYYEVPPALLERHLSRLFRGVKARKIIDPLTKCLRKDGRP